jgi:uncharacterized membrane protein
VIVANLFLVATIVLLPFTTEAVGNPDLEQLELPTVIFALDVAASSILLALIHWLAWRRDLFGTRPSESELRGNLMASAGPALVFLVSIPIAYLVSPDAAKLSWLSLLVLSPLAGRIAASRRRAD